MKRIFNVWLKKKTKNYTLIPLFTVTFNYQKFKKLGKQGSCVFHSIHPDICEDKFLKEKLCECVDYIRDNYDMEIFTRI